MQAYIGGVMLFAGNFAPKNFAFCQGQLLSIAQNTALFSILGTTYGGDGRTTFALPDLRGRVPTGPGQGPGLSNVVLGEVAGFESVTLLNNNLPFHNHLASCDGASAPNADPTGGLWGNPGALSGLAYYGTTATAQMSPQMIAPTGNSQPVSVEQPYLGLNYIICLFGIFPSRN